MADKVIWTNASMLANHNKVLIRISELKAALVTKILWTRERSVDVLSKIAEEDIYKGGEKVAAVRELNLMHGYNEPKKDDADESPPLQYTFSVRPAQSEIKVTNAKS